MHILIGLAVVFVVVLIVGRKTAATRGCRWREDRTGNRGALRKYRCARCGAEAFTASKGPPQDCKSEFK